VRGAIEKLQERDDRRRESFFAGCPARLETMRLLGTHTALMAFHDVILPGRQGREFADNGNALPCLCRSPQAIRGTQSSIGARLDRGVRLMGKPYTQQGPAQKIREILEAKSRSTAIETKTASLFHRRGGPV
jgi:hypothetical protein